MTSRAWPWLHRVADLALDLQHGAGDGRGHAAGASRTGRGRPAAGRAAAAGGRRRPPGRRPGPSAAAARPAALHLVLGVEHLDIDLVGHSVDGDLQLHDALPVAARAADAGHQHCLAWPLDRVGSLQDQAALGRPGVRLLLRRQQTPDPAHPEPAAHHRGAAAAISTRVVSSMVGSLSSGLPSAGRFVVLPAVVQPLEDGHHQRRSGPARRRR